MRIRVKICGITNEKDALAAVELGADALGFNFWPQSPRYCEPQRAVEIVAKLPPLLSTVGVFVNPTEEWVTQVVDEASLSAVQLHGDESPDFCARLRIEAGFSVIKAVRVDDNLRPATLALYQVNAFLLDSVSEGYGGSGKAFDWALLKRLESFGLLILAGGLNADNVAEAISLARPYAVDVASGVEARPGIKDYEAMAKFFEAVGRSQDNLVLADKSKQTRQ